ncbi:hypothetical protein MJI37_35865, partial [Salmonella enterica subsp. enterica serovar Cerro]|nr:hypothetical protein [Salmonella enterica subsp. enterica serovar Cerro]
SHLTSSGLLEQPLATRPEVQRIVAVNWIQQRQEALDIIYRVVNLVTPTSAVVMGGLAIARVPYVRYLKWVAPLLLILTLLNMA